MIYKNYKLTFDNPNPTPDELLNILDHSLNGFEIYSNDPDLATPWDAIIQVSNTHKIQLIGNAGPSGFGHAVITLTDNEINTGYDIRLQVPESFDFIEEFKQYGWIFKYTGIKYNSQDDSVQEEV